MLQAQAKEEGEKLKKENEEKQKLLEEQMLAKE